MWFLPHLRECSKICSRSEDNHSSPFVSRLHHGLHPLFDGGLDEEPVNEGGSGEERNEWDKRKGSRQTTKWPGYEQTPLTSAIPGQQGQVSSPI